MMLKDKLILAKEIENCLQPKYEGSKKKVLQLHKCWNILKGYLPDGILKHDSISLRLLVHRTCAEAEALPIHSTGLDK